jgi:hypothetical protein
MVRLAIGTGLHAIVALAVDALLDAGAQLAVVAVGGRRATLGQRARTARGITIEVDRLAPRPSDRPVAAS